jgi:primosomal protein N' (replication factor Y) (superfamily II helicase)
LILNPDQEAAVQSISDQPDRTYLLHGITGSGKTQVYIESAKKTLAAGRSVILLVPEIALGAQLEARFRQAFGDLVITNHSQLTPARRRAAWIEALTSQTPKVAIGPRSTLFLPFPRLGLIVIDECHETTYKQEQSPRYCADSVAAKLSQLTGAKLVLGSATPGLNQLYLTSRHRARLLELRTRPSGQSAPRFSVVDLRAARQKSLLSPTLVKAMVQTLDQKRQVLLFLNRRGTASGLLCSDCGWVARCPQCAISLTFHADQLRLLCHYCNFRLQPPTVCPLVDGGCGSTKLRYIGGGTKRIEAEAAQLFPNATIRRLDRDSATPAFLAQTLHDLHNGVIDILVGTQMIAKGFDLPAVDTVGIVSADTALHIPDYTASERTFQLILQAAGRTGRGDRPGHVVIQSYTPDHPAIVSAMAGDYSGFAARELSERQALNYPPFVFLLKLTCTAPTAVKAMSLAESGIRRLQGFKNLTLTGPAPTLRTFGSDKHQLQLIVRSKSRPVLVAAAGALPAPSWTVDLDPVNLL